MDSENTSERKKNFARWVNSSAQYKSYYLKTYTPNIPFPNIRTMKLPYYQHRPPFYLPGCSPVLNQKPETNRHHSHYKSAKEPSRPQARIDKE